MQKSKVRRCMWAWERQVLSIGNFAHNLIQRSRVSAVQRVDNDTIPLLIATKAQIGQDPHSDNRASHTCPDDMPYASLPDLPRLGLNLLQPGRVFKQACHTFDPIEF